ncbi:hypothetical protein EJ02DRAFT_157838 [Clathrospora elynae]|uniref:Uncharacterized protein n=1 Tax=Clathrospora elynae TaxID=706981 RepID=A0A6A5STC0_9PLEO|nr:hypothetical protein EJ02DRAFT_157838 [Clathrospora elynae]
MLRQLIAYSIYRQHSKPLWPNVFNSLSDKQYYCSIFNMLCREPLLPHSNRPLDPDPSHPREPTLRPFGYVLYNKHSSGSTL